MTISRQKLWQQVEVGQRVSSTSAKYADSFGTVVAVVAVTDADISKNVLVLWDRSPATARLWTTSSLVPIAEKLSGDVR